MFASASPNYIAGSLASVAGGQIQLSWRSTRSITPIPNRSWLQRDLGTLAGAIAVAVFRGSRQLHWSYQANGSQLGNEYIISGRIDYNLSEKDHLFWRVRMDHGTQPTSADLYQPASAANSKQPAYDGQGQWTHVFSPNLTNQFVYAGSYYRAIFTQDDPRRVSRTRHRFRAST